MKAKHGTNVLSGVKVKGVMRRHPVTLARGRDIELITRTLIKYKVNAVLIMDEKLGALGVVSKTDLMGAYYAGIPLDTPATDIMTRQLCCCTPEETIETALRRMQENTIHRVYVSGGRRGQVVGVITYADVVGFLYRICNRCDRSILRTTDASGDRLFRDRYHVSEVMSAHVPWHRISETLAEIMEGLGFHRRGAVLIRDDADRAVGVISKTDLIIAYRHGIPVSSLAEAVMSTPVVSCTYDEELSAAIRKMIFTDLHRIYVSRDDPANIVGILSLADAARVRSGSCRACVTSRIELETSY
jgi:CBS domain-containing protein